MRTFTLLLLLMVFIPGCAFAEQSWGQIASDIGIFLGKSIGYFFIGLLLLLVAAMTKLEVINFFIYLLTGQMNKNFQIDHKKFASFIKELDLLTKMGCVSRFTLNLEVKTSTSNTQDFGSLLDQLESTKDQSMVEQLEHSKNLPNVQSKVRCVVRGVPKSLKRLREFCIE